jgi:hypothetical protein
MSPKRGLLKPAISRELLMEELEVKGVILVFGIIAIAASAIVIVIRPRNGTGSEIAHPIKTQEISSTHSSPAFQRPNSQIRSREALQNLAGGGTVQASPISYGGAKDLWVFSQNAVKSGRTSDLLEAFGATNACDNYLSIAPELTKLATDSKAQVIGQLTAERQIAISELNARCAGFSDAGPTSVSEFRKDLIARLSNSGYEFKAHQGFSVEQLKHLLVSDSPDTVGSATIHLLGPWQTSLGIPDGDPRENELAVAVTLAQCDLGKDCSVGGWESLHDCALEGRCNQVARSGWESGFDAQQIARIAGYRQQVVAAVRNRDWNVLGLDK